MTNFNNLRCVAENGTEAPLIPLHPDNPYGLNWDRSPIANAVRKSSVRRIKWDFGGIPRAVQFQYIVSAVLDPNSDLLIVALHYNDLQYRRPCNAVVINTDGNLNHQIVPPKNVEILPPHSQEGVHPVESIDSVLFQNGRVLFKLGFQYEWIERRYYNVASGQCEERDYIARS